MCWRQLPTAAAREYGPPRAQHLRSPSATQPLFCSQSRALAHSLINYNLGEACDSLHRAAPPAVRGLTRAPCTCPGSSSLSLTEKGPEGQTRAAHSLYTDKHTRACKTLISTPIFRQRHLSSVEEVTFPPPLRDYSGPRPCSVAGVRAFLLLGLRSAPSLPGVCFWHKGYSSLLEPSGLG